MARKLLMLSGLATVVMAVVTYAAPVALAGASASPAHETTTSAHAEGASAPHGTTVVDTPSDLKGKAKVLAPPPGGWSVPSQRNYTITSSCQPYAAAIRQGAAAWAGLREGGGTPVECRNGYITDCGGGSNVVGCNWGSGQRIALYMGGVNDDALLAAHEFGHDWYGHSTVRCAAWDSPTTVMSPTICN
ncbi:hypothetical protein OG474_34355 [Kribbella sp. NBC_01505]|uniref:hypothetical protein n=1 Tax=Kribbella sp. NBC_01505 TaxID=2903580 RepID=UPI00386D77A4